jgi:hypothetical protein
VHQAADAVHDVGVLLPLHHLEQVLGCIFCQNSNRILPEFFKLPFIVVTLAWTGSNDQPESVKVT